MQGTSEPTVPKAELLERERRWSRPAGIAALLGVALAIVSVALQQSAVGGDNDTDTERLINIHEHASEFFLSNVLQGLAFLLFAAPLWFLFKAAQGRTPLVRTAYAILAIVGPALLFSSQVVSAVGLTDVADKFDQELPSLERETRQQAQQGEAGTGQGAGTAAQDGGAGTQSESKAPATEATEGTQSEASETENSDTGTTDDEEDSEENTPTEDRAEDLVTDSSAVTLGSILSLPGFLGFVVGMVYIPLWAMRTGLLSRFWGSLGMAIGVVVVVIPPAQLALMLWMAAIGLMLIGLWPRGRPAAWEAGVAIPWQKPGEPPPSVPPGGADASGDTVDGSGRELSEPPLPEDSPPDAPPPPGSPPEGESQGQRRKKRKRRD